MVNTEGPGAPVESEGEGKNADPATARPRDVADEVDERKADADFDDLIIEVDESELESELSGQPPVKKY